METVEVFAASAGVGQALTHSFEPSCHQPIHDVGGANQINVQFNFSGTLPEWVEWKLETSDDGGATWRGGPATLLWGGTATQSRMVHTRPGTSMTSVQLPRTGCVRLLARRNGGDRDTTILAVATFENVAPARGRDKGLSEHKKAPRRDLWGRPIVPPPTSGGFGSR